MAALRNGDIAADSRVRRSAARLRFALVPERMAKGWTRDQGPFACCWSRALFDAREGFVIGFAACDLFLQPLRSN